MILLFSDHQFPTGTAAADHLFIPRQQETEISFHANFHFRVSSLAVTK
jgi:hypothetical protein